MKLLYWGTLELKAIVGQLFLNNSCAAHLIGREIHHKSCVICSFTWLHLYTFLIQCFSYFGQYLKIEAVDEYKLPWERNSCLCKDDIMIMGTYVQVQGEVATEYLMFKENWDLFCDLTQICLGDLVVSRYRSIRSTSS